MYRKEKEDRREAWQIRGPGAGQRAGQIRGSGAGQKTQQIRGPGDERNALQTLTGVLQELLYPPRCPICDAVLEFGAHGCCAECDRRLPRIKGPVCMKCGKPVADGRTEYCEDCGTQRHLFERGVAAFTYTGPMRASVYRMKAGNRRDYLPFFAEEMAAALSRYLCRWAPELILPVPMHPRKRRARGFSQSELLARRISALTGIPAAPDALECVRAAPAQKTLGRKERMRNLRGSFRVREPFYAVRRVLVVDDVYTTGSTMDELSRVLLQSGVERVYFVVLCTGKGKKAVCTE